MAGLAVDQASGLLERESELADLAGEVAAARFGIGRLVLVEGPAGVGKSALLTAARSLAEAEDLTVISARGAEFESGFAFGVVRQLFEPLLRACSRAERARLVAGPAGLAGELLGMGDLAVLSRGDRLPEVVHGLYWLTLNLAERRPLLAVIDDAHWADPSSLRFLGYLAGRLDGVAALAVIAARPAGASPDGAAGALAAIEREATARVVRLGPLSAGATAALVQRDYGRDVAPAFAGACHGATGGNPFLLRELVRALRADGVAPDAAGVARVAQEGPASVARSVLTRVAKVSSAAVAIARALAVLGGEARLRDLAQLTSLDQATAAVAVDLLEGAEIVLSGEPVSFTHPIVHASIYDDIPAAERDRAHLSAARLLASEGATGDRVAAQLMRTRPAGDRWTVGLLGQAAVEALAHGAPEVAAGFLVRALAEPPASADRHRLLALLGRAQYLAGQPGAAARLLEAIDGAPAVAERGELALEAAKALVMSEPDRSQDAVTLLDRALGEIGERDSQLSMRLQAQLLGAAGLRLSTRPLHRERLEALYPRPLGDGPADRLLLANLAAWTLIEGDAPGRFSDLTRHARAGGQPADVAREVAERAIAAGALIREQGSDSELLYLPINSLCHAGFLDDAEYWLGAAIEDARKRGSVIGYAQASAFLAEVAYRRGDLATAEAHARAAAAVSPFDALAVHLNILTEQGRLDEAERLLYPRPPRVEIDHLMLQPIHAAVARLRITQGRPQEGVERLLACGEWLEQWGAKNPSLSAWRSSLALTLYHDDHERARELVAEEVALAQALGLPAALGVALRVLGLIEQRDGLDHLQHAVEHLERSPARLEHARALIDYGAALRRAGHRAEARKPLREGLNLAHHCGATALAEHAREELLATGARPRRPALTGRDALTATEARIADMAAKGLSSPEIAQALFVTPKTIETHLGHVFQKLDIHSRAALAHALSSGEAGRRV